MSKNRYVMTERFLICLKKRFGEVKCRSCGFEIEAGDRVVTSWKRKTQYWIRHEPCFERMLVK